VHKDLGTKNKKTFVITNVHRSYEAAWRELQRELTAEAARREI